MLQWCGMAGHGMGWGGMTRVAWDRMEWAGMVNVYLALYIHSLYIQLYIHVYTYLLSQIHVSRILKPLPPREFTAKRPAERRPAASRRPRGEGTSRCGAGGVREHQQ